ncbi:UNVERIFIED_CONTAM: hypothetical protein FKN15_059358 [Acipenser sinensis]
MSWCPSSVIEIVSHNAHIKSSQYGITSLHMFLETFSFHVGSNSSDPHCFSESIANARGVFDLGADLGHEMTLLDIGGGFPGSDDFIVTFEEVSIR